MKVPQRKYRGGEVPGDEGDVTEAVTDNAVISVVHATKGSYTWDFTLILSASLPF
jgi:hypothetical protein